MESNILPIYSIGELLEYLKLKEDQRHPHFHIVSFSDHQLTLPEKLNIRSECYFEITFSSKGNTEVLIEGKRFQSDQSHLTFLSPGQSIRIDASEDTGKKEGYILFFTREFLNNYFTEFNLIQRFPYFNIHFSPVYFVEGALADLLLGLMSKIYSKFQDPNEESFEIIQSYLNVLLLEAKELLSETVNTSLSRAEEITFRFENLLKQQTSLRLVKEYAESLFISPIYLSECVKSTTGQSAKKVITEYKIQEAKSLLTYSESSIDEIANNLGFDDRSNFINFFKKNVGSSPLRFRRVMRPIRKSSNSK